MIDLLPFIALLVVPLAFLGMHHIRLGVSSLIRPLVLAAFIWALDGRQQSTQGDHVIQAMGIASTLWPIAFAAVLGPTLRTVALFRAERGITIRVCSCLMLLGQTIDRHAGSRNAIQQPNVDQYDKGLHQLSVHQPLDCCAPHCLVS